MNIDTQIQTRLKRVREWALNAKVDALFLTPGDNFFYLTGFQTEPMERLTALIVTQTSEILICPKMLEDQVTNVIPFKEMILWDDGQNPFSFVNAVIKNARIETMAIEGITSIVMVDKLKKGGIASFKMIDDLMSRMRSQKSPEELDVISEAIKRSEKAYEDTLKELAAGITEIEISGILEHNFKRQYLEDIAFRTIIAFGENTAIPHHEPTQRKLRNGDLILMDFGGKYHGYSSDTTRTVAYNSICNKFREIYEIVRTSQVETIISIHKNTKFSEMDSVARSIISKFGYGDNFIHRVGHGLGIATHEEPYLVPKNQEIIKVGTVFTIEPGIYIRDVGGVRIEDTLMFDGEKAIPFNSIGKELIVL